MKHFLFALLSFSLIGCGTTPVMIKDASLVPNQRILNAVYLTPTTERTEPVTIVRDKAFKGGGILVTIAIEGDPIASFDTSERLTVFLPPGRHATSSYIAKGIFGEIFDKQLDSSDIDVFKGKRNNFRINLTSDRVLERSFSLD